jgi:hypothetical protein
VPPESAAFNYENELFCIHKLKAIWHAAACLSAVTVLLSGAVANCAPEWVLAGQLP